MRPPISDPTPVHGNKRPLTYLSLGILTIALLSLGTYLEPFETPWLKVPPAAEPSAAAQKAALETWLWENHLEATQQLLTRKSLAPWLQAQLENANRWGWSRQEQIHFLLEHQLSDDLADLPAWGPRADETPDTHFVRVQQEILQLNYPGCTE